MAGRACELDGPSVGRCCAPISRWISLSSWLSVRQVEYVALVEEQPERG